MKRHFLSRRNGSVLVLVAVLLPALLGLAAFAFDIGHIAFIRSRLQAAADAAALAGAEELPNGVSALSAAQTIGGLNLPEKDSIVASNDVEFGNWSENDQTFTTSPAAVANAVRVTAELSDQNGNPLPLFFGSFVGVSQTNVSASAIAITGSKIGTRFLIDDEMIDKDIPAIEDLAIAIGRDVEELVTPRGFNQGKQYGDPDWTWEDNFLDIPAGTQLSLPTGQGTDYGANDAGLFDIDHPEFPFTDEASFRDFVMYSESGGDPSIWGTDNSMWGTDNASIYNQLDPLRGTAPVTDGSQYSSFVDPNYTHVSPVTFSDVSTLGKDGDVPQINAKGLRRGLIAFKIIAVGVDIDGAGSILPELVIEFVDPTTTSLNDIKPTIEKLRIVR